MKTDLDSRLREVLLKVWDEGYKSGYEQHGVTTTIPPALSAIKDEFLEADLTARISENKYSMGIYVVNKDVDLAEALTMRNKILEAELRSLIKGDK